MKTGTELHLDDDEFHAYNLEAMENFDIWNARRQAKIYKLNRMIMMLTMERDSLIISSWPGGLRQGFKFADESTDHQL
jgi:hypothetical protein